MEKRVLLKQILAIRNKKTALNLLLLAFIFLLVVYYERNYQVKVCNNGLNKNIVISNEAKHVIRNMQKIVHFDLKGAPPKIGYFKKLINYLKYIGATGVLIEYEDMFPYSGVLDGVKHFNAYTQANIQELIEILQQNDMIIIPLIQTYGHLEFILKLEKYAYLRESPNHYQVITPCIEDTYSKILFPMIDQILEYHPKYLKHIHIGCDEVYHIGKNSACEKFNFKTTQEYFINHVSKIADYIHSKRPGIDVIIWDDMIRNHINTKENGNVAVLKKFSKKIKLMVWDYVESLKIDTEKFKELMTVFNEIWIASAFKGATEPLSILPNVSKHYLNHISWLERINNISNNARINGIALTGWSRFDHVQGICELLPAAIPSLVLCLQTILYFGNTNEIASKTRFLTKCSHTDDFGFLLTSEFSDSHIRSLNFSVKSLHYQCNFPSSNIYEALIVYKFHLDSFLIKHNRYSKILNDFNLEQGYINTMLHEYTYTKFYPQSKTYLQLFAKKIKILLNEYYYNDTIQEFIEIYINHYTKLIDNMMEKLSLFLVKPYLKQRPLTRLT